MNHPKIFSSEREWTDFTELFSLCECATCLYRHGLVMKAARFIDVASVAHTGAQHEPGNLSSNEALTPGN